MNRKIRNAIINLLKQYLIKNGLYNEDNRNTEQTEKPILILITRKGYWLFRLLYDEWCDESTVDLRIFNQFTIYSDRYLTKVIEPEIFEGKKVLIFDDIMVHGNNLFYYYVMLEKWFHIFHLHQALPIVKLQKNLVVFYLIRKMESMVY